MNRYRFILIPLILLFAAGLGFSVLRLSSASGAVPAETVTIQTTATPTRTSMPTATATPTATLEPTATATPTPAPITLPVTNGTPIPDLPYEVITTENVQRLREIARYGYPRLLETNPYRLTADGKTIVVGTTLGLEFYDAQTQEKTGALEVEFLRDYDLTPDGQYLLTFAGEKLTVWTRDGRVVRAFDLPIGDAWALNPAALSPDGALLAVQRKKADWQEADKVDVYRVADGSLVDTVRGMGVVFSPDGQYLATVFDGSVRLYPVAELGQGWEKRLPKQTLPWCGDANERCGLAFSPDGTLAAVVRAARVDVYQVAERKLVRQVSGWEAQGTYYLPQVQVAEGRLLVTTLPVYDSQGKVQTPAQAIVVDIVSGEWVSKSDVESGFAYLDGGQVRTFWWQAEGEMPNFWRPYVTIENDKLILREVIGSGFVTCVNQECIYLNSQNKFIGPNGIGYILLPDGGSKYQVLREDTGESLVTFSAPKDAYIWFQVIPSQFGDVVVVEVTQGRSTFTTAYRSDGRRAEIADNFVEKILFSDQKIVFSIFSQGLLVLDIEHWSVNRLGTDEDLIYFSGDKAFIAKQSWEEGVTAVQLVDLSSRKSDYILVPGWRMGTTWGSSGYEIAESAEKTGNLFLVSTGGLIYAIDLERKELIGQINATSPYSNAVMKISPNKHILLTYGTDGFIRVWAVVPEGANVR